MCKDQERSLELPEPPVEKNEEYNKYDDPYWGKTVEEIADELCKQLRDIAKCKI